MAHLISSLLILCVLFWFPPAIAGIDAMVLLVAGVVVPVIVACYTRNSGLSVAPLRASLQVASTDLIRGLGELQVAGAVSRQTRHLSQLSQQLISAQRHQAWISAAGSALSALAGQAGMFCAFVLLITAGQGSMLAGNDIVMLVFAVLASTEAVAALPAAFAALGVTLEAARRIFSLADLSPAITLPAVSQTPQRFDLDFSAVTMRYAAGKPAVLDSLSFQVPEGHCLALLGPSGAGKTTILNLIQGFWDCEAGTVSIGGYPVRELSDPVLRQVISVVGQKTYLFNASVRDNLRMVAPDADDERLWQVLARVSLDDEVRAFPHGLDTLVGELGARLSGGQARRIAIARAFLSEAPVILLDEPTEGLDATNTDLVLRSLKALVKGKTTLLVTHQIQPLILADSRLVLEGH